jgi:hypothetical protein
VTGYDRHDRAIDLDLDFSPEELFEVDTLTRAVLQDLKFARERAAPRQPGALGLRRLVAARGAHVDVE